MCPRSPEPGAADGRTTGGQYDIATSRGGIFGPVIDAYLAGDVTDAAAALEEANAKSQQVMDENASTFAP